VSCITVVFSSQPTKEEISTYKDSALGVMAPIQTRKFPVASDLLWFDSVKNSVSARYREQTNWSPFYTCENTVDGGNPEPPDMYKTL